MSLESVFANPPSLVGPANKESGEEAKERSPFFYEDDDSDTQEYDPDMINKLTPKDDQAHETAPKEVSNDAPACHQTPVFQFEPPVLQHQPAGVPSSQQSNEQSKGDKSPSKSPRSDKSPRERKKKEKRHRSRSHHKSRKDRRHEGDSSAGDAPHLDWEGGNNVPAAKVEDGELEDGEIDDEDGPPQLSPHRPAAASNSESETENKPYDEDDGEATEKKKRSEKRKKKRSKEKSHKKKRAKYTDHDKVGDEPKVSDWPLPHSRSPASADMGYHKPSHENRSPPGPYDSPYSSPPGPYDSPSDDDDYGPPNKMIRKDSKKSSMLSMLSGEYTDVPMTPLEQEEMYQQMRSMKKSKKEKGRGHKDRQGRQDKNPVPPRQRCKFYMEGKCAKGRNCTFSHDFKPPRKSEVCKFYINDMCAKGKDCVYMHGDYPCKYFHMGRDCLMGAECKFSHEPLDEHTQPIFEKIAYEDKDFVTMMIEQQQQYRYGNAPLSTRKKSGSRNVPQPGYDDYKEPQEASQAQSSPTGQPPTSDLKKIPSLFDIEVFPPPLRAEDSKSNSGDESEAEGEALKDSRKPALAEATDTMGSLAGLADTKSTAPSGQGPPTSSMGIRPPLPPPAMLDYAHLPSIMAGPPPRLGPRPLGAPPPMPPIGPGPGMPPIRPPRLYSDMVPQGPPQGLPPPLAHQPGILGPPPNMLGPPPPLGIQPAIQAGLPGPCGDPLNHTGVMPVVDGGYYGPGSGESVVIPQQKEDTIQSPEPEPRQPPEPHFDIGKETMDRDNSDFLNTLPPKQRELFLRIQQQQRQNVPEQDQGEDRNDSVVPDDNWYSSDEEESSSTPKPLANLLQTLSKSQSVPASISGNPSAPSMPFDIAKMLNVIQVQAQSQTQLAHQTPNRDPRQAMACQSAAGRPNPRLRLDPRLDPRSVAFRPDPRLDRRTEVQSSPRSNSQSSPRSDPRASPRSDPRDSPRSDPRASPRADGRLEPHMSPHADGRPDPRLKKAPTLPIEHIIPLDKQPDYYNPKEANTVPRTQDSDVIIHCSSNGTHSIPYMLRKMIRSVPVVPTNINPSDPRFRDDPRMLKYSSKLSMDPRSMRRQVSSEQWVPSDGSSPRQPPGRNIDPRNMDPRIVKSGASLGLTMGIADEGSYTSGTSPALSRTSSAPPMSPAPHMSDPRQMKALGLPAFSAAPRDSPPMPTLPPFIPPKPTAPLHKHQSSNSPSRSPKRDDITQSCEPMSHRNDPRFKKKPKHDRGSGQSPTAAALDPRQRIDPRKTFEHRSPLDAASKGVSEPSFGSFGRSAGLRSDGKGSNAQCKSSETGRLSGPARHYGMPQVKLPTRQSSQPALGRSASPSPANMYPSLPSLPAPEGDLDQNVRDVFKTIDPTASPFC